jgi:hypothetical protein
LLANDWERPQTLSPNESQLSSTQSGNIPALVVDPTSALLFRSQAKLFGLFFCLILLKKIPAQGGDNLGGAHECAGGM